MTVIVFGGSVLIIWLLGFSHHLRLCRCAIGDSRVQIAISNTLPAAYDATSVWRDINSASRSSSAMHHGATVRLYDPVTDLTYHRSNDPRLVEVLSRMWNPKLYAEKCGSPGSKVAIKTADATSSKVTIQRYQTLMCDPDGFFLPSQAHKIDAIINVIPETTGCQCDSLRHCNQYKSGFSVYVAVVPFLLDDGRKNATKKVTTTPSSALQKALSLGGAIPLLINKIRPPAPVVDLQPTNLIVSREMSGVQYNLIQNDADIYDLIAFYLRAMWATGECDEDMVICFFPKDRKISLSIGGRLFDKLTSQCLNDLMADTLAKLSDAPAPADSSMIVPLTVNFTTVRSGAKLNGRPAIVKRQTPSDAYSKEETSAIFEEFVENINELIQSRQDDPCAPVMRADWTQYEILGVAIATGLGVSITVLVMLRLCNMLWNYVDKHYDEPSGVTKMLQRRAREMRARQVQKLQQTASISIIDNDFSAHAPPTQMQTQIIEVMNEDADEEHDGLIMAGRKMSDSSSIPGINDSDTNSYEQENAYESIAVEESNQQELDDTTVEVATTAVRYELESLNNASLISCDTMVVVHQLTSDSPSKPSSRPTFV